MSCRRGARQVSLDSVGPVLLAAGVVRPVVTLAAVTAVVTAVVMVPAFPVAFLLPDLPVTADSVLLVVSPTQI